MNEVPHFHYERISSTNDVAKELLATHCRLFVSADYQYNGRGRNGRTWEGDGHKNIYLSYAVNEVECKSIENKALYQIIGSLAVERTLSKLVRQNRIKLKYPNDVYVENSDGDYRKIAGILSEHSYLGNVCTESILGIGLNVYQEIFEKELGKKATSLRLLGYKCDIDEVLEALKSNVLALLTTDEKVIFETWKENLNLVGKSVILIGSGSEYTIDKINADGSLLASNQNGSRIINNGDSIIYGL